MGDKKDVLRFPNLMSIDHPRHCQQYTNVISRPDDDSVSLDEIDNLQMDLETLLAAATSRMRQLHTEIQILNDMGESTKKEKRKDTEQKRSKPSDERPTKKLKISDSPSQTKYSFSNASSGGNVGRTKAKGTHIKLQESDVLEEPQSNQPARIPINDAPNKFWQSIESYCVPIQHETIRMLEQMIQGRENIEDYLKVPELGVPFSQRWALEDMREEQSEGNRANVKNFEKTDNAAVHAVLQKATSSIEQNDSCPFGSLTQRLVSAFIEENVMISPEQAASLLDTEKGAETSASVGGTTDSSILKPSKSISSPHAQKLETRIKLELIEQGILEPDTVESKKEDEILNELISCQQELKAVTARNRDVLQQLSQASKEEMKKQETRKKLEASNTEVMEHYRRVMAARQKRRTLVKKEKDAAWKALRDRDLLIKQLV